MKLLVIHSRDLDKGSTRFRVVNYQPYLEANGIEVDYVNRKQVTAKKVAGYDVLYNQKCRMSLWSSRQLLTASSRTLFDFDDAIYTRERKPYGKIVGARVRRRLDWWLAQVDLVTTANDYLATYARQVTDKVLVIPMAVDLQHWSPAPRPIDNTIRIGWAGRPGNLRFLHAIENELQEVLRIRSHVELAIYSGAQPELSIPFQYQPFSPGTEAAFCQTLDIGLLPLADNDYSRGKSPIKAIQYLACGVPIVGNIVGASAEIVTPDAGISVTNSQEWVAALLQLVDDMSARRRMGEAGRRHVLSHHDQSKTRNQLLNAIQGH